MKKCFPLFFLLFAALACSVPGRAVNNPGQPTITQPVLPTPIHATQNPGPTATSQAPSTPEILPTAQPPAASQTAPAPATTVTAAVTTAAVAPGTSILLGSPFASNCGNGIPQIWRNASFNAEMPFDYAASADDQHGYVTFYPPEGCDVAKTNGEVVAPADGELRQFAESGYTIVLPDQVYPTGLTDVLKFAGIQSPDLSHVTAIQLQFGKYMVGNGTSGPVKKGQSIGDISTTADAKPELDYQVIINYDTGDGVHSYIVSPTLFQYEGKPWPCVKGSPYRCEPKAGNFKP